VDSPDLARLLEEALRPVPPPIDPYPPGPTSWWAEAQQKGGKGETQARTTRNHQTATVGGPAARKPAVACVDADHPHRVGVCAPPPSRGVRQR